MLNADLIKGAAAAAAYLGITRRVVYNMVARGDLPAIKKGETLFFRKSELERAFSSDAAPNA